MLNLCSLHKLMYYLFQIIVISSFLHFQPLVYVGSLGVYVYPDYANVIGWTISGLSMSFIPLFAIYKFQKTPGSFWIVSILHFYQGKHTVLHL